MPALEHREVGRYREAAEWLQAWLASHPEDAEALAHLAQVLSLNKQDELAWAALSTALAVNSSLPVVQRNRARLLLKQQKTDEALQAAHSAYQGDAKDPENQLVLAAAMGAKGQNDQAFALVESALQARPGYAEAFANRALLKLRTGNSAGALADAEAALSIKPHLTQFWPMVGSLRYKFKNLPGAIEALETALAHEPDNVGHLVSLGEFKRQAGEVDAAIAVLEKAVAMAPDNAGAWVNLGTALQQAQHISEAKEAYAKALEIKPEQAEVANNLGVLAKDEENWEEALRYFEQALALQPAHIDLMTNRAVALNALGQHEEAEHAARKAVEADPDHVEAHLGLSGALTGQKHYEAALAVLESVAPRCAGTSNAHSLAMSYTSLFLAQERWTEAEEWVRRALVVKPGQAKVLRQLGGILDEQKHYEDAWAVLQEALENSPEDADTLQAMASHHAKQRHWTEAEAWVHRALEIKPDYAEAHYNLGNTLKELGRLDEAEASYRRVLEIKPDYAEAHYNLGNTLKDLGRLDEAEASYRRVLEIKPDYAEAHNNLGNILNDLGRLEEAEASYRRALEIKPDYVEAHSNLGNTLKELGRLYEAEASYRRALEIKPDSTDALNNLALLLNTQGKSVMALNIIKQSLQIKETGEAKSIFVACVKRLHWTHDNSEIRIAMVRASTEPWGRPSKLVRPGTDLVKLNPDIGGCVARAADAWPLRLSAQDLFGSNGLTTLASDPLLCALLNSAPICDIEMERFLTMARRAMLEAAAGIAASDGDVGPALSFYSALARQCFINEYVFSHTDDEIQKASDLRESLVAALQANTQVPVLWPIAVAAYFPLCSLPLAARLLDSQWPEAVTAVLVQQVCEPGEELQECTSIPRLTDIEDEVSLLVQHQYEENPYPRWIKAEPAGKAKSIVGCLCQMFPLVSFKRHGKSGNIDVLIAGCGTGRHSIETAQRFQGAQVLAVDLSMSSLGYAKRKTRELGLTSIEYAQADLLKLGSLGRSFDVIESVGVLHHLADPLAGWQVLLSLLRPGGFMMLGFYSEVARRNIVKARAWIAEQGYGSTVEDIRRCRQDVVGLDNSADFGTILKTPDFFSISSCRDLLFHVREHRMTLTSIDAFLRDNNLVFLGFEMEADILHAYKLRFPDDRAATNLGQWQIFENENPDTFYGMYQFWIQKVG